MSETTDCVVSGIGHRAGNRSEMRTYSSMRQFEMIEVCIKPEDVQQLVETRILD